MDYLRKATSGQQQVWSKSELKAGFVYFAKQNGRFPTSHEIDAFEYLPSARSIQRTYGGLVALRRELFPNEIADFTIGSHRSGVAKKTYSQGRSLEEKFYNQLIRYFQQIAIHEHKVIRPGNVNCDFFVYLDESQGIVIDIFYAESIINYINVINIKLKRYSLVIPETYLVVVGNDGITQDLINKKIANRKIPLPAHVNLVSEGLFFSKTIAELQLRSKFALRH